MARTVATAIGAHGRSGGAHLRLKGWAPLAQVISAGLCPWRSGSHPIASKIGDANCWRGQAERQNSTEMVSALSALSARRGRPQLFHRICGAHPGIPGYMGSVPTCKERSDARKRRFLKCAKRLQQQLAPTQRTLGRRPLQTGVAGIGDDERDTSTVCNRSDEGKARHRAHASGCAA